MKIMVLKRSSDKTPKLQVIASKEVRSARRRAENKKDVKNEG
jgi:hypothetical protein